MNKLFKVALMFFTTINITDASQLLSDLSSDMIKSSDPLVININVNIIENYNQQTITLSANSKNDVSLSENEHKDQTKKAQEPEKPKNIGSIGFLRDMQDADISVIGIFAGSKVIVNTLDSGNFSNICIELHSNSEGQKLTPADFESEVPIYFKNSKMVLHGDAQFHCLEEVTLDDSDLVFDIIENYQPQFVVKNLDIKGLCRIKIGNRNRINLKNYLANENKTSEILRFYSNMTLKTN